MGGDDVSRKEEEDLMLSSKAMLEGDRLGMLANRQSMRGEDKVRASDSSETPAGRRPADVPPQSGRSDVDDDGDRLSVRSETSEEDGCSGQAIRSVSGFVDVQQLSSTTRKSAAPHIFNIYEQIFCDGVPSHQVSSQRPTPLHPLATPSPVRGAHLAPCDILFGKCRRKRPPTPTLPPLSQLQTDRSSALALKQRLQPTQDGRPLISPPSLPPQPTLTAVRERQVPVVPDAVRESMRASGRDTQVPCTLNPAP